MKGTRVLLFVAFICSCSAKLKIVVDDEIKDCTKNETRAGVIDFDWEIIQEGEDEAYFNGTWTMLKDLVAPWPMNLYTMQLEQGKWVPGPMKRKIKDFCATIHSPLEVWYSITKKFPKCPWKKGTVLVFDMIPVNFNGLHITSSLEGKWEAFLDAQHPVDGTMKDCCVMIKLEFMDL